MIEPSTKHELDCPCNHLAAYTSVPCDNCLCLPCYGTCSWSEPWGDQYAGGTDHCSNDSLPGSHCCGMHGGTLVSENARLTRRLELAAKKFDAFVTLVRELLNVRENTQIYGRNVQK